MSLVSDSMLEDTVPQYVNQPPIENSKQSTPMAHRDGANATVNESSLGLSAAHSSISDGSDFESLEEDIDRSIQSIAHSPSPGKKQSTSVAAMDGEQADTPGKGLVVRDGKVQVLGRDQTHVEIDSSAEESLDYGCVPKNRRERSPSLGSAEEDESSQGKGNKPTPPQLVGAFREEAHDPDHGPTDEQLLRAVRSIPASVKDIAQLTPKQALLMLEKQFSCSLKDRKKLILREMTQTIRGSIDQDTAGEGEHSESEGLESNGNFPVEACSSPSSSGDEGKDKPKADPLASENSVGENDSKSSSVSGPGVNAPGSASEDRFSFQDNDGDGAASSSYSDGKTCARSAVDEVERGSASSSESSADSSPDSGQRPSAEATPSESELDEDSDLPDMPRPRASKTPARRALAKAKMSAARGVRASKTRRTIRQSGTAASSASNSDSELLDSDSDPGSTASSAKPRTKTKQQEKNNETGASPGGASDEGSESAEAPRSAGSSITAGSSSDLGESTSSPKHVRRSKQGKGKKKSDAKRKAAKRRMAGKAAANDDGDGSALLLVDSDEEAGRSKTERPSSVEKAVVQEELDDVNEEKLKERKRIAAERQRQLDALRVMNVTQLKEATRAQQGNLLAKIKERQARIHAEMAATSKEELRLLRVEARRAAGITDEAEEDEEEEESGTGLKPTDIDGEKDGNMDIEDIVAKEEAVAVEATASAPFAVGQDHVDSTGEEVEEEGEDGRGFAEKEEAAANDAKVENSSRALRSKTIGGDEGDSDEEAMNSSESDSDSELEILPANSTSALAALVKRFDDPSGGVKLVAGRPQQTQMISRSGNESSTAAAAQGAAARALAALPKGVRFSSPKMADSVRAANRRRLAASARAVANDRWAAQLGYQDGQEHIRDLKYMELKRRQQAHRERERKAKENEAMEARLREYAANADAEEEEFGADPSDCKAPTSSPATVPAQNAVTSGSTLEDDAAGGIKPTPEDVSMDSLVASEGGAVHKATGLEGGIQGSNPVPGSEGGGSRDEACEAKNGGTLIVGATESSRVAIQGIAPEGGVSESDESSQRSALSIPGVPQGAPQAAEDGAVLALSDQVETTPAGDAADVATNSTSSDNLATTVLPAARPKIVRTYGRKKPSGQSLDQASKVSFKTSEQTGGSDSTTERSSDKSFSLEGGGPVASPESQALWEEELDSEPPSHGAGPESLGEDCSCSVSLNLFDEGDEGDEATQQSHSSSKGPASVAPSQDVGGDGGGVKHTVPSVILDQSTEIVVARALEEDGNGDDCQGGGSATILSTSGSGVTTKANAAPTSSKIKLAADGGLVAAPIQPSLPCLFKAAAEASSCSPHRSKNIATVEPPLSNITKQRIGIAAYFGVASNSGASAGTDAAPTQYDSSNLESESVLGSTATAVEASFPSMGDNGDNALSLNPDAAVLVGEKSVGAAKDESRTKGSMNAEDENIAEKEKGEDDGGEREREAKGNDEEKSKEPRDRSAKFRAMLEAERETNRRLKKLRKTGMMDEEAEEEEEEEAVRGLGDFGFGVPAGGTGTSAMGNGDKKDDEEEEGIDEEIREEDLEGIVDTFSDDEGDKDAQEAFLKNEAAAGDRQALKDMVRRVREGFGEERGGRGRGANARGNLRLDELTAADKSSRKEARRLGLLNSDEEWSDDEKGEGNGGEKDDLDELDEVQLGELLAREQRARHMGLSQTAQDYLESSDSEGDEEGKGDGSGDAARGEAEDAERREEYRIQKLWVKKAKRRRVLAEVEQAGAGNSQSRSELFMQEDEDSQAILSLLHCTNSRLGVSGSVGGGVSVGGNDPADASANKVSGGSKRRARDQYTGELDAQEVENGFGMGMSSKPLKRTKSDGTKPKGVDPSEAEAKLNRAFTMPQFVTSVAGYGSSTRAKQIQRKGSFLARSRSLHARSGSLAAGKTTVSASKFVFVSSASGADDDTCARTGFENSASRDSFSAGGGGRRSGAPSSALEANSNREKAGVLSEIGVSGKRKIEGAGGGPEMGRLWKGLCANGKPKSRR